MRYCEDLDTIEQVMQAFEAFVDSLGYERDEVELLITLKRVRFRVANTTPLHDGKYKGEGAGYYDDDDAQVLYGFLVLTLGDYGTAPRSGWIYDSYADTMVSYLDNMIKDKTQLIEMLNAMKEKGVE